MYILLRKPFEMGDRIQIGISEGDILDINFFEFTMLEIKNWVEADQSTGRIIHIPNGFVFTQAICQLQPSHELYLEWNTHYGHF